MAARHRNFSRQQSRAYWLARCRGASGRFLRLVAQLKIDRGWLKQRFPVETTQQQETI